MSKQATAIIATPIALCEANGAVSAPECIQILPMGLITPNDGRGPWRLEDPRAVIAETRKRLGGLEMMLDYNHQSEHAAQNGRPAPAAGWITELEARPDGIFGKVAWTRKGAEAVAAREFRYISPVFNHDAAGRVRRIISCALTNTPALDMAALCEFNGKTEKGEDMDAKIIAQRWACLIAPARRKSWPPARQPERRNARPAGSRIRRNMCPLKRITRL